MVQRCSVAVGTLSARHTGAKEASMRAWGSPRRWPLAVKTIWPTALSHCPGAGFLFASVAHAELRSAYHTVRRDSS